MQLDDLRRRQAEAGAAFTDREAPARARNFGAPAMEYRAIRSCAGLLDRTNRGALLLRGSDRLTWLQGLVSNDVRPLADGSNSIQACVLDATGHMQGDISLVRLPDAVLAAMERSSVGHIGTLLDDYLFSEDVTIEDVSGSIVCLSVQGRHAPQLRPIAGPFAVAVVDADHCGEGGFDLYLSGARAADAWTALQAAGAVPVGDEVADVARVEAGIPVYGIDMDASMLPLEAGLEATHINTQKGCYVGQEIVARILSHGKTNRALSGLLLGGAQPVKGDRAYLDGRDVGWVTSVVTGMGVPGNIALCYLRHEAREPGMEVSVATASGEVRARVAALPFVARSPGAGA